jgi:hypothetical protein
MLTRLSKRRAAVAKKLPECLVDQKPENNLDLFLPGRIEDGKVVVDVIKFARFLQTTLDKLLTEKLTAREPSVAEHYLALHQALDELMAAWAIDTHGLFSEHTITELMQWSYKRLSKARPDA